MLSPYKLSETSPNFYEFTTDYGVKFILYFVDVSYYFEAYPEIIEEIYTFGFEPVASLGNIHLHSDKRVELTIIHSLRQFFVEKKNALIYVCESSDGKHFFTKKEIRFVVRKV